MVMLSYDGRGQYATASPSSQSLVELLEGHVA